MQEISKFFNSPVVPEVIFFSGAIPLTRFVTGFTLPQAMTNAMILRGSYEITRNKTNHPLVHSMLSVALSVAILSTVHFSMAICFPHAALWTGSILSQYRGAAALKFFPLMALFQSIYALTLDKKVDIDEINAELIDASRMGYIKIVEESLNQGANVNAIDEYKKTALIHACERGHTETVKFLLNRGANIDAVDASNITSLASACMSGHLEIVQLLLDRRADIDAVDITGNTPLILACFFNRVEIVQLLLDKGANVHAVNKKKDTALSLANRKGYAKIAELLSGKGATI